MTDSATAVDVEAREVDLFNPAVAAQPLGCFDRLRRECPVANIAGVPEGSHVVSRYEDVRFVLRHPEIFSSDFVGVDIGQDRPLIPLQIDPPHHATYRRVLDPELAPRAVAYLEEITRPLVNRIIDGFIERGECDFHAEFAVPVPATVFLGITGLPLDELDRFLSWKNDIIRPQADPADVDAAQAIRAAAGRAVYEYFDALIDDRMASPGDDLISRYAHSQVDGREMSREEILDTCYLFLIAGLDTVTSTLDCAIAELAGRPEHRRQLAEQPEIVPQAVEEMLRLHTPVMQIIRVVAQPHELHGVQMNPGDHVVVLLGAADTDPDEFGGTSNELDFGRESNRHFAFGGGPHRCLGSHLARLELRVALEELHRRIPDYEIAPGIELAYSPAIREIAPLPIVFTPGSRETDQA